jgi:hypothetical protein
MTDLTPLYPCSLEPFQSSFGRKQVRNGESVSFFLTAAVVTVRNFDFFAVIRHEESRFTAAPTFV